MKGDDFDRLFQDGGDDLDDVVISPSNQPISVADPTRHFGCPLWWFNAVYSVVHSKAELAVAIYLCRRRVISGKHKTFDVPNGELKSWGILA